MRPHHLFAVFKQAAKSVNAKRPPTVTDTVICFDYNDLHHFTISLRDSKLFISIQETETDGVNVTTTSYTMIDDIGRLYTEVTQKIIRTPWYVVCGNLDAGYFVSVWRQLCLIANDAIRAELGLPKAAPTW